MASESSQRLLSLLGLRLKGFSEAKVVAELVGLDIEQVDVELSAAAADGHTIYRRGARSGWTLTAQGRAEVEHLAAAELESEQCRAAVQEAYQSFLGLNPKMLEVCTRWQVKDLEALVLNDHNDAAYDRSVMADLVVLDKGISPVCDLLGGSLKRFGIYRSRLTHALDRVQAGETDWFTAPLKESYHTVWFELHEDLLATLGIDRTSEQVQ